MIMTKVKTMNKKIYGDILFNILIIVISLLLIMFSEKFINLITSILGISLLFYAIYKLSSEIKSGSKSIIKVATIVITFFIGILLL